MKKFTGGKVQQMFVDLLMRDGAVELALPNGVVLEVGITQENRYGELEKVSDYCWVVASHKHRSISIDKYNLGIRYTGDKNMICEYSMQSADGVNINILDLV